MVLFGATAFAECDADGNPIHWKAVPGHDGRWQYIPGHDDCDCEIQIKINMTDSTTFPNYDISAFLRWYAGALDKPSLFTIGETGCFSANVGFVESNWEYGHDRLAISTHEYYVSGEIFNADILVNLVDFSWYSHGTEGQDMISSVIGHEIGHCIGMTHDYEDGGVMVNPFPAYSVLQYSATEIDDTGCIYKSESLKIACVGGESPAFFGLVECESESGSGALLSIETLLEVDVSELVIKWAPVEVGDWPSDDQYTEIERLDFEYPSGGNYSFLDPGGEPGDMYLIEALGLNGQVDNSSYFRCGSTTSHPTYPEGLVDEMRAYSLSKMHFPQWKSVFSGENGVQSVESTPPSCDFLVIAFDDFVQDVTPICDYWQWSGFDVELVSCNGQIHSADQIRNFIAGAHAENPLQAVWLVGSPDPTGDNIDLVPTFSSESGFDFPYSDFDNDSQMDIPVGRLPAQAIREVVYYINKELRYHVETAWGGKKDPEYYSTLQVFSVPDHSASGSSANWSPGQWTVYNTAVECAFNLIDWIGWCHVEFFNSPDDISEWYQGDNASYRYAIRDAIFHEFELGRHLVFGFSNHNSSANLFGVINGGMWQSGVDIPGEPGIRPCETFWIVPECYSNSYTQNVRKQEEEPLFLNSNRISVYELFMNRGLLVFGSSGPASHSVTQDVAALFSQKILQNRSTDHARSIGDIWMEVYNEVESSSVTLPPGLKDYCIFGDPMLYVRDVYSETSAVGMGLQPLAITESPNPFNGRIKFHISGLQAGGGSLRLYDIRGRLVKRLDLPKKPDTAVMTWDAKDGAGRDVASGVYFAVVTNHSREVKKKIVYIK